jgi:hypothetical protein
VVTFIAFLAGFVPLLQVTFFALLEDFYPARSAISRQKSRLKQMGNHSPVWLKPARLATSGPGSAISCPLKLAEKPKRKRQ